MNYFYIVSNPDKDPQHKVAKELKEYLEQKGKKVTVAPSADQIAPSEKIEFAIILGGDGTMIQAAKIFAQKDIPILGVNLGTLGFLTEVERQNATAAVDLVLEGSFRIEERIALEGVAKIHGKTKNLGLAVNDFIIGKRGFGRLITTKVYVNGELVDKYVSDGILVSTPTGSTAYNLSAGGPLLSPCMEAIVITPICPHALNKRSIVVSASDKIKVEVGQSRVNAEDLATISVDGGLLSDASTRDTITIGVSRERIQIVKLSDTGFFERMRSKLNRQ